MGRIIYFFAEKIQKGKSINNLLWNLIRVTMIPQLYQIALDYNALVIPHHKSIVTCLRLSNSTISLPMPIISNL